MARLARLPVTALLGMNMFFSGVTYAATMPYASLVGVDTLGMSPGWFGTVMAAGSVIGTFTAVLLGYVSDRLKDRRLLVLLTALAGMLGHGLIYLWPSQAGFAIAMAVIMPFGLACFSQSLAYVRVYYMQNRPERADFMVTALRTVFTVAWIIVPPVAGWVAAEFSIFDVYLASAVSYALIAGAFALLMGDKRAQVQTPPVVRREGASLLSTFALPLGTLAGLLGMVIIQSGTRVMSFTIPLFIVSDLGGTITHVGFFAGITAAIEAPCMLLWAWLTTKFTKETLLASAGLVMALFMFGTSLLGSVSALYWLLVLNGLGTAAMMSISISYAQDAIKGRVGLSTSLLDLIAISANLLGATGFAILTSGGNYRFALLVAAAVAAAGAVTMALGNVPRLGRLKAALAAEG